MEQSSRILVIRITGQAEVVFNSLKLVAKAQGNKSIKDLIREK